MYRAKVDFYDLQDGNRFYKAGESYPRLGLAVSEQRFKELAGDKNRMGHPLIEPVAKVEEERPTRKRVKKDD